MTYRAFKFHWVKFYPLINIFSFKLLDLGFIDDFYFFLKFRWVQIDPVKYVWLLRSYKYQYVIEINVLASVLLYV